MKFLDKEVQQEIIRLYTDLNYSMTKIAKQYDCGTE